jgi:hypothetical protein
VDSIDDFGLGVQDKVTWRTLALPVHTERREEEDRNATTAATFHEDQLERGLYASRIHEA